VNHLLLPNCFAPRWSPIAVLAAAMLASLTGCSWLLPPPAPLPTPTAATVASGGVNIAAAPARRLLVTRDENQGRSRLLAVWIRLENTAGDELTFNPDEVVLAFADGSAANTLDRERSNLLIDRLEVAPTDEAVADYPDLWSRVHQSGLKQQLRDGLLTAQSLGAEAVEGYVLVDTKQGAAPLEGAVLRIPLMRSDGTPLRPVYNFTSAAPAAAALSQ
jgi:hypothetical protein